MSAYGDARAVVGGGYLKKGPRCQMCTLLDDLDPESAADVKADLANPLVVRTAVGRSLAEMGHPIRQHILDRHARGDCDQR